jgi:hypothetical protein
MSGQQDEKSELRRLRYDALTRQLERMRGMQYAYFAKFFTWLGATGLVFLVLFLSGDGLSRMTLPFLVITAGVQASFYLHLVDFARVHARAIEKKINELLGEPVLVAHLLEDAYFYPLEHPRFSGFAVTAPSRFFSAFTVHWCGVWAMLFVAGLMAARGSVSERMLMIYGALLAAWSIANVSYLAWFFLGLRDQRRITALLQDQLGPRNP